ncbi:MAG: M56 family metallopeptidase [Phycisphaerae bacterium]|jgi:beta-lactamase regulating signal transducer with metallopeptidase domain
MPIARMMHDLSAASATLLAGLGQALLCGTLLALLTWVVLRPLHQRVWPGLEVALWTIVLVKFIVPVGPAWSWSLASVLDPISPTAPGQASLLDVFEFGAADTLSAAPAAGEVLPAAPAAPTWHWGTVLAGLYVLIVAVLALVRLRSYRLFRARCHALPAADEDTEALVRQVCRRLGVWPAPLVRMSESMRAPFVLGFVRPILVLSCRQLVRPDELETVIVHEVTHLRRGDMLVRLLQWFAGTLLFFWPVVAWVNRRIDRAREHACDEWALRHGKLTAGQYARCLLAAVQPVYEPRWAYRPACMAGSPSTIERRIDVILTTSCRPARRPVWGLLTLALALVWGGFVLTGAAGTKDQGKKDTPKYGSTEQEMRKHADVLFARINEFGTGDIDGDGQVDKVECWAFVTAVVMQDPAAVLAEYPEADLDEDGELTMVEAYQFARGDQVIQALQKKMQAAAEKEGGDAVKVKVVKGEMSPAEVDAYHFILDRRDHLLDLVKVAPTAVQVKGIADKMAKIEAEKAVLAEAGPIIKLHAVVGTVSALQQKAAELRAKAAELDGDAAAKYEAKAADLDRQATEMKEKATQALIEHIKKLEVAGKTEEATEMKEILAKLQEL